MKPKANQIKRVYFTLLFFNTLASSLIWGINTLFLLDAGLSNTQAFTVNAFFTLGQVVFEIPTGIVADIQGRRKSYLLGAITLSISTFLYYLAWYAQASMLMWIIASIILGLGFTFFSGATEAWLVDALKQAKFKGKLDSVFARGQTITGIAMLTGSVAGGLIAQSTNLGTPYIIRALILLITFIIAFKYMFDYGFKPATSKNFLKDCQDILTTSVSIGFKNPAIRYIILAAPFVMGVSFYAFYALQPYLLELWGDPTAYSIAGLTAAIIASAQIIGGLASRYFTRIFTKRTTILIIALLGGVTALVGVGLIANFWAVIILVTIWGLLFSAAMPARQAYLNALIPSEKRATVLSFDNLIASAGGVITQPVLGRAADAVGYASSYLLAGFIQLLALPLLLLARRQKSPADTISTSKE